MANYRDQLLPSDDDRLCNFVNVIRHYRGYSSAPFSRAASAAEIDAQLGRLPGINLYSVGHSQTLAYADEYGTYVLTSPAKLFASIDAHIRVFWKSGPAFITQRRYFEYLRMSSCYAETIWDVLTPYQLEQERKTWEYLNTLPEHERTAARIADAERREARISRLRALEAEEERERRRELRDLRRFATNNTQALRGEGPAKTRQRAEIAGIS